MADPIATTGHAPARLEGADKVSGRAVYASDVALPGQLYGGILRSILAHASIGPIDSTAVREIRGVRDVITANDVEGIDWYEESAPLFTDQARFIGDELAAVAAESEEIVFDALAAFDVDYRPARCVVGLDSAASNDAPEVHAGATGNLAGEPDRYQRGVVEAGFAHADVIVEGIYSTQAAVHHALEAHCCNAAWIDGILRLWVSTQGIRAVRDGIAEKLGLSKDRVRVVAEHVGGGFGAKQIDWKHSLIAALLARRTGRPVKIVLDRRSESLAVGHRNATRQHVRIGARRDGRLTAIDVRAEVDIGAYTVSGEGSNVVGCYQELYDCANVRTEQRRYYTNLGPAVAFRGPGYVEGLFALEQAIDELALKLDIDPLTLREINHVRANQTDDKPFSSPTALIHCYRELKDARRYGRRTSSGNASNRRRGIGIAAGIWLAGGPSPPGQATVKLKPDGTAVVLTGTQDIGTGTRTVLAQIAAGTLGLPIDRVQVVLGDTGIDLDAPTSAGSATLPTMGPAVHAAARAARARLEGDTTAGTDTEKDEQGCIVAHGSCDKPRDDIAVRTFAAFLAEVEVDMDTAEITVLRIVCAPDCGHIVNAKLAESQVVGGVTQGLGFALMEQRIVDNRSGNVLNANLEEYLIPTVKDIPVITHARVDRPDFAVNDLGIKGLGEPPIIAVAPAIANAVCNATGLRLHNLPIDRRQLLDMLAISRSDETV